MLRVDLNADVGESFGARRAGDDEPIFRYVTSGNVACGFHAGSPVIIAATIKAAKERGVAVGAHPSYPDTTGFGRQSIDISSDELADAIVYQIGAVAAQAKVLGVPLVHVKPHGALYNDAAKNPVLAAAVANAVAAFDRNLILVGLAGSVSIAAAKAAGLRAAAEAFCDRAYEADGSLRSRTHPGALIEDPREAAAQAVDMVVKSCVTGPKGENVRVSAHTLCVHGDTPNAAEIASAIRAALGEAGVSVVPMRQVL